MLQGITEKGELKNVIVDDKGAIKTTSSNINVDENGAVKVVNENLNVNENGAVKAVVENVNVSESGAVKVELQGAIEQTSDREVVLNSSVLTVGTEATTIELNKKVTNIMIANYSETADITINTGSSDLQVGASLALELPINLEIATLSITSTEADTKVQLVVKGVE